MKFDDILIETYSNLDDAITAYAKSIYADKAKITDLGELDTRFEADPNKEKYIKQATDIIKVMKPKDTQPKVSNKSNISVIDTLKTLGNYVQKTGDLIGTSGDVFRH